MNRFRTIAVTAVAGIALVACGPAASSNSGEPSSQASEAAASQAQASSGGGVLPSFTEGAVADLEALIPETVGDLTMLKESMQGDEYLLSSDSDPAMVKFLQDVGVSPNDISMAMGYAFSADFTSSVFMFVVRAEGADSNTLLAAFQEAMNSDAASPLQWSSANVGGKQVQSTGVDSGSTYLYAQGDVVFWITADPASAEEVLSGLP